jgi:AraC family transcriptional regulator of adaptative response/methylated-DNA-[protein]-cysteine methyltransferase
MMIRIKRATKSAEEVSFEIGQSSLGTVLVASSEKGVVSIMLGEDPDELMSDLERQFPGAHFTTGSRADRALVKQIIAYIEKPVSFLDILLDIRGAAFQKRVWRAVQEVPAGQTRTYTEIARQVGSPKAMRAVGNACAVNPFAFVVPCHRIVRSDGAFARDHHRVLVEREKAGASQKPSTKTRTKRRSALK